MSHQLLSSNYWFVMDHSLLDLQVVTNEPLPIEWDGMEVRYAQEQNEYEASDEAQNPTP